MSQDLIKQITGNNIREFIDTNLKLAWPTKNFFILCLNNCVLESAAIIFGPLLRMTQKGMPQLPFFLRGVVVKGFGRGAKELGCPTANFSDEIVEQVPPSIKNGIYYGFAQGES